jgi:hypothetical protein
MAIFQPAFVLQRVGADWTLTATVTGDVSGYALRATFRDQIGASGTAWATKTTGGGGIVATYSAPSTSVVITLDDTETDSLTPGAYVWQLERTDAGGEFALIDWSTVLLTPGADSETPQLMNLSQVIAMSRGVLTETVSDTDAKYYLMLIAAAEATFRRLCGRTLSYGSYVEWMDAPAKGNLFARETPVHSVTEIRYDPAGGAGQLDDTFGAATVLVSGTDYFMRKDRPDGLNYSGEIFTTRPQGWAWWGAGGRIVQQAGLLGLQRMPNVGAFKVTYLGGYKLVPADVIFAVTMMVTAMTQRTAKGIPKQSESGMNYSYTLASMADEAMRLDSVQAIIAGYRRGDMNVA